MSRSKSFTLHVPKGKERNLLIKDMLEMGVSANRPVKSPNEKRSKNPKRSWKHEHEMGYTVVEIVQSICLVVFLSTVFTVAFAGCNLIIKTW